MAIRQEKSDARKQRISRDISLVRQNELKVHVERYNQHENQVYIQLKTMIKKMNVCMNDSEEISKHIEGFLAFYGIFLQFLIQYFFIIYRFGRDFHTEVCQAEKRKRLHRNC